MSLGVFQNLNATDYMRTGKFAAAAAADMTWLATSFIGEARNGTIWLDRIGLWQANYVADGAREGFCRIDPLLVDNTSDAIKRSGAYSLWNHIGAYVPLTGEQRLFATSGTAVDLPWQLVDYNDPTNVLDTNIFPNAGSRNSLPASGLTSADIGWYDTVGDSEWLFFEGWDHDGSGNTVGTAVVPTTNVRVATGAATETTFPSDCTVLVNLQTGAAVPISGLPSLYQTVPANDFQAGELFGETNLEFDAIQFLPDDDSTRTAPKGQLFMSANFSSSGLHFGKWIEWNPEGATGSPVRTHLRERLISKMTVSLQQSTSTYPGPLSNSIPSTATGTNRMKINRQTGRPTLLWSIESGTLSAFNNDVYHSAILEITSQPVTSEMTKPAPRQDVTTNRIVIVGSEAVGDLGERVAGQDVTWSLGRISTRGETLATTPSAGETVTVANVPIDRNFNFPFDVYKDGTPLVETTNYSVNESLGQITFVAPEPVGGSVYTIDYAHPTKNVQPPFGQLLAAGAVTDENGEAFTRVRYLDEPLNEGFVDELTVDTV